LTSCHNFFLLGSLHDKYLVWSIGSKLSNSATWCQFPTMDTAAISQRTDFGQSNSITTMTGTNHFNAVVQVDNKGKETWEVVAHGRESIVHTAPLPI
jgi:hypothetical protein